MSDWPLLKMQEIASKKFDSKNVSPEFRESFILNSLAYENDWVTSENVKNVLSGNSRGLDPKQVSVIENHAKALSFVIDLRNSGEKLDENKLKDLHELLMAGIGTGGLYRNVDISVKGSNHTPPSHLKVYDRMKKYFETLEDQSGDVFEKIAYSHLQLAKIHPFLDGNGRCSRLVLAYEMMVHGLFPVIIPSENKEKYFQTLEEFKVNKNIVPFITYLKQLEQSYLER